MKKTFIISALGAMLMASCADEFDTNNYVVDRPAQTAAYAYLNDYQTLKSYVDHSKYPNFKLGVGTTASDYIKKELTYALVTSNFDETEPGNCMKMASCVSDNGTMDFGLVSNYVEAATDAGVSVYGHTLAWHAQQPVKWLNSLLKDKELDIDPDAKIETEVYKQDWTKAGSYSMWGQFPAAVTSGPSVDANGLTMTTTGTTSGFWELQYMVADGISLEEGAEYLVRIELSGTPNNDNLHFVIGPWGTDVKAGVIDFNEKVETRDITFTAPAAANGVHMLVQSGDYVGTYTIKCVTLYKLETPAVEVEQEIYYQDWTKAGGYSMWGQFPAAVTSGPSVDSNGLTMTTTGKTSGFWELQYMVADGIQFKEGVDYVLKINVKGDPANDNLHYVVGAWGNDVKTGVLDFNGEWATKTVRFTSTGDLTGVHVLLQSGDYVGTYTVKDVQVCEIVKMNSIPLTPEEKKDTLTWAMDRWINGMMEACEGRVKAWDAVNEAISGADLDGDGIYDLQHGKEGDTQNFFWQDYLGDYDYVPTVIRLAREYGPEDVKLFINDYNLESDWDDNAKLKSLIKWIERWETPVNGQQIKIDGIGSQMHLKYYANANTQKSKENHITKMFELMRDWANAGSGRFIRVSELDIEYVDANGKNVSADAMTEDQLHEIANFYKWIVQQYMSIIPADRQWGICSWSVVDADPSVSWTHQQLYGYWNKEYYRTHSYAGLADGLSGK